MKRTISAMVGKGSVNHNSRKFKAENVNGERSHLNVDYCNEPIKQVYHKLFDEALDGITPSRHVPTGGSTITMKRSVSASRKSPSMS